MKGRAKKADTFLVKIMDHEHATWQGKVTWIEGQRVNLKLYSAYIQSIFPLCYLKYEIIL